MISYVIPTRDRPEHLARTLGALGRLDDHARVGGAEVIVVDNASKSPPRLPLALPNALPVHLVRRPTNEAAAARNAGVRHAHPASNWIVMLDDDSHPVDTGHLGAITRAPLDVAAVTADIHLPAQRRREAGGLPEVPVGCAVAYRRDVYERLGGYDPTFEYYVEEYDLAARILLAGYRVHHDPWFRVAHHKVDTGRDFNRIIARLVRNNAWVAQRYAPDHALHAALEENRTRYERIATKENALDAYTRALHELDDTLHAQPRTPLPPALYDRFTGLAHARAALRDAHENAPFGRVILAAEGKNAWAVKRALAELGATTTRDADTVVIATMSPGPMTDALQRLQSESSITRVIAPWRALQPPNLPSALTPTSPHLTTPTSIPASA